MADALPCYKRVVRQPRRRVAQFSRVAESRVATRPTLAATPAAAAGKGAVPAPAAAVRCVAVRWRAAFKAAARGPPPAPARGGRGARWPSRNSGCWFQGGGTQQSMGGAMVSESDGAGGPDPRPPFQWQLSHQSGRHAIFIARIVRNRRRVRPQQRQCQLCYCTDQVLPQPKYKVVSCRNVGLN